MRRAPSQKRGPVSSPRDCDLRVPGRDGCTFSTCDHVATGCSSKSPAGDTSVDTDTRHVGSRTSRTPRPALAMPQRQPRPHATVAPQYQPLAGRNSPNDEDEERADALGKVLGDVAGEEAVAGKPRTDFKYKGWHLSRARAGTEEAKEGSRALRAPFERAALPNRHHPPPSVCCHLW